jgi:zinc protease
MEGTDGGVIGRELSGLLHAGDRRFTFPSREDLTKARLADLQAQIGPHLTSDPIEVVIVGDITVDKAIDAVAGTLGSLPPRPAPTAVPADQRLVGFPTRRSAMWPGPPTTCGPIRSRRWRPTSWARSWTCA